MAVHNGGDYVCEAVQSIRAQTITAFEFVIVDDASTDGTAEYLAETTAKDPRMKIIRNQDRRGLTSSLNRGLRCARGDYVVRIDADDRCTKDRISRQVAFLEANPDHVTVACGYDVIDITGRPVRRVATPLDDWQVRRVLGFNPPAPHPAFCFRRSAPDGTPFMYDEAFTTAQDYDLWARLSRHGKIAVTDDVLIEYRRHPGAITIRHRRAQAANCQAVGRRILSQRLPADVLEKLDSLLDLFAYRTEATPSNIAAAVVGGDAWLAHELPSAPSASHRRWFRRTVAGLLADAILSRANALRSARRTTMFLFYARRHLPWLAAAIIDQPAAALKSLRAMGIDGELATASR